MATTLAYSSSDPDILLDGCTDPGLIIPLPVSQQLDIVVFDSFEDSEEVWRALEAKGQGSVYQRYDWCRAWFELCASGHSDGAQPLVIVGQFADQPAFLLPMVLRQTTLGALEARFMGDSHANIRLPLVIDDEAVLARLVALGQKGTLIEAVREALCRRHLADLVIFDSMPTAFNGRPNPFAAAPTRRPSPLIAFTSSLGDNYDTLVSQRRRSSSQRKDRQKLRKLGELGTLSFQWEHGTDAVRQALEAFFAQKAERQHAMKATSSFDDARNRDFIHALAQASQTDGSNLFVVYTLRLNDKPIAVLGGGYNGSSFSLAINSISNDQELMRHSPGMLALNELVRELCAANVKAFDLGLGELAYKDAWCDRTPLWTVAVPLSMPGRALAAKVRMLDSVRAFILADPRRAEKARMIRYHLYRLLGRT